MNIKVIRLIVSTIIVLLIALFAVTFIFNSNKQVDKKNIIFIIKNVNPTNDFWQIVQAGAEVAAKEFNVELNIDGPWFEKNYEEQIEIIENKIRTNPSAIILAACDVDALVPVSQKIVARDIALITVDSGINSNLPISFIATDNVKAGETIGEVIEDFLSYGDSVAIIAHVKGTAIAIDRERGVRNTLEKSGKLKIIDTFFCDNIIENAYNITIDLINMNSELKGIITLNALSTIGAAKAIDEMNLMDKVYLVGFDKFFEELQYLEQGIIKALIIQKPFNMGYLGVKTAVDALNGEQVPLYIDTGYALITIDNMNTPENQKLIFPLPVIRNTRN